MARKIVDLRERFAAKVLITDSCHYWLDGVNENGYGRLTVKIGDTWRTQYAHRVAWFLAKGSWPKEVLRHSCDTPICVNVDHLTDGTQLENIQDSVAKGRNAGGKVYETHCKRGHLLAGANLYRHGGKRHCRACRLEWKRGKRKEEACR